MSQPPSELPQQVAEFVDLSKRYLQEEVAEPAKALGRVAGVGIAAGLLMAIGTLLLSVAAFRLLADVIPEGPYWEAGAYLVSAIVFIGIAVLIVRIATRQDATGQEER